MDVAEIARKLGVEYLPIKPVHVWANRRLPTLETLTPMDPPLPVETPN
jgi:hypothetical protein